ncbi:MAG: hypothetical protein AB8F78_04155 [Saprospiraceae bacterium]
MIESTIYQDIRTVAARSVRNDLRPETIVTTQQKAEDPPSKANRIALQKLKGFLTLEDNWDGYGSFAISEESYELGKCAVHAFERASIDILDISPGPSDELELAFKKEGTQVRLLIDENSWQWAFHHQDKATTFGETLTKDGTDIAVQTLLAAA